MRPVHLLCFSESVYRMVNRDMEQQKAGLLDRIEEVLISLFLGVSTLLVFAQVVARYAFNSGFTWAPELVEYFFLWTVMIGASYGVKHGVHLGVDVLVTRFKPEIRRWIILTAIGISTVFTSGMCYLSIIYVRESYKMELLSVDLQIPQWIPHLALPFGFALITFRFLQVGVLVYTGQQKTLTRSNEPGPDTDELEVLE